MMPRAPNRAVDAPIAVCPGVCNAAVSALLDRLLHHANVLKCGPKSFRTRGGRGGQEATG